MRAVRPLPVSARFALVFVAALTASGCAKSPIGPRPPAGGLLTISCPSTVNADSPDGNPVTVSFETPRTVNGLAPVSITCSTTSGSPFAVGATAVTCEARDAGGQAASCGFNVMVRPPPTLRHSSYMAFGDSLTEGVVSLSSTFLTVDLPASYPTVLRNLLRARYPTQSLTVINAGNAGELASGEGIRRVGSTLSANQPEVLLLMEGTNDLLFQQRGIEPALTALEAMMAEAEARNIRVCLATIPPQRPGGFPDRSIVAGIIPGFNDQVRALAARRNAILVDVYAGMKDDLSLLGRDNLHPTPRGYEVMASIFEEALVRAFDSRQSAPAYRSFATVLPVSRTMRANGASR
jgi:lysophospholipase L1-like esterase